MAVQIPISASASGVTSALREIQDAIRRAGQEGTDFARLDLSHPELRNLGDEIRRVQARFEDLARVGRGTTATAVRAMQRQGSVTNPLQWAGAVGTVFPSPAQQAQHMQTVGNYIFQGTRWQQSIAPTATQTGQGTPVRGGGGNNGGGGAAPQSPVGGGRGLGGIVSGIAGAATPFIGASLALAGIHGVSQFIGSSVSKAQDESIANENLLRRMDDGGRDHDTERETAASYGTLREAIRKAAEAMNLTYVESQRLGMAWARLTNDAQVGDVAKGVQLGTGLSRSYGLDPGVGVQALGQASYQGLQPEKFAQLIGETVRAGGQSGQVEQVMQALLHWSEGANRAMVSQAHMTEYASMYAGMNATENPGMHGQNAEAMLGTLNTSLSHGGNAGPASMALTYRAMQHEGVTDPYEMRMLTEGGMFANARFDTGGQSNHRSETTLLAATMAEIRREYAGQPEVRLLDAMENHTGLNMRQSQALLALQPADLTRGQAALDTAGLNIRDLNPTAIKSITDIAAPNADLESWRKRLLERHGEGALSADEKTQLEGAGPNDLRTLLVQLVGRHGQEATEGTETRASLAKLDNSMTKVGSDLLTPINQIREFAGATVSGLADLGSIITNVWKAGRGDAEAIKVLTGQVGAAGTVGGNEPNLTDATKKARAAQAVAYFQTAEGGGWSRSQAIGIAAQAGSESGWQAHGPAGDSGLAKGAFQWHPDRQAAIEKHFGKSVDAMSWEEQMQAKAWELSPEGPERAAGSALRQTTTAWGAGYAETVNDERPALRQIKGVERGAYAESLAYTLPEAQPARVQIAPLEVIHKDSTGRVTHTQQLPVTTVTPPRPWGPHAPGTAPPTPPAPPAAVAASP